MNHCKWSNEDPREALIGRNRALIVVVRPSVRGGLDAGTCTIEMKHGWFIHTSFEDHPDVDVWDPAWLWIPAPGD
jgi:hypothetical protein